MGEADWEPGWCPRVKPQADLPTRWTRGVLASCQRPLLLLCMCESLCMPVCLSESTGRLATRTDQESPGQGACVCPCLSKDKTTGGWLLKGAGKPWLGVAVCVRTHACTHARFSKSSSTGGLAIGGTRGVPASSVHMCVNNVSVPAAGVELWAPGLCKSTCQQLGRLGSRGQLWANCV